MACHCDFCMGGSFPLSSLPGLITTSTEVPPSTIFYAKVCFQVSMCLCRVSTWKGHRPRAYYCRRQSTPTCALNFQSWLGPEPSKTAPRGIFKRNDSRRKSRTLFSDCLRSFAAPTACTKAKNCYGTREWGNLLLPTFTMSSPQETSRC